VEIIINSVQVNLFAFYFKLSDSFAEKELASITSEGNCDESVLKDVKKLPMKEMLDIALLLAFRKMVRRFRRSHAEASVTES
jgi:hypothetical protein